MQKANLRYNFFPIYYAALVKTQFITLKMNLLLIINLILLMYLIYVLFLNSELILIYYLFIYFTDFPLFSYNLFDDCGVKTPDLGHMCGENRLNQ